MPSDKELPEWVHVWAWLRFAHNPPDFSILPQQALTMPEYENKRAAWQRAGGIKAKPDMFAAALAEGRRIDDDDIPF